MKNLVALLFLFPTFLYAQTSLSPGVVQNSFTAATVTISNGTPYAIPGSRGVIISWQTSFATAPTSITVLLQGSLDNTNWFTLDTTTVITGTIRHLGPTAPKFVRCRIDATVVGPGTALTCSININTFNNTSVMSGGTITGRLFLPDGTAALPSLSFSSLPTSGFTYYDTSGMAWVHAGVNRYYFSGTAFNFNSNVIINWTNSATNPNTTVDLSFARGAAGRLEIANSGAIGSAIKVDALPTAGTCGTSPAVTAGSTPFSGSINVGTATPASCIVVFGGTAFPSAPFCTANVVTSTAGTTRAIGALSTTTQVTFTPATAFADSSVVAWHCISAK